MGNSTTAGRSSARGREHENRARRAKKREARTARNHHQQQQHSNNRNSSSDRDGPPPKRRRVNSASGTGSVGRPPVRISVTGPHGVLQQTTNGVREELPIQADALRHGELVDRKALHPQYNEKRVLRSQDEAHRLNSALVHFFPDYEEVIFASEKEHDALTVDSTLYITEDKSSLRSLPFRTLEIFKQQLQGEPEPEKNEATEPTTDSTPNNELAMRSEYEILDFSQWESEALQFPKDPLPDIEYFKAHKRGERNEKQLRNVEKERAMHEKAELERLYDELRGPDWLKSMGISGITETEKKKFEPKRDYYIARVRGLLHKFETWREKEKDMKVKRDQALAAKAAAELEEAQAAAAAGHEEEENALPDVDVKSEEPSVFDASALQLLQEAKSARRQPAKGEHKRSKSASKAPEPERPFTSFYKKPHERDAAVGKHRRGRYVSAFGQPLPEMEQADFILPSGFVSRDEMRDNARRRRREKREGVAADGS